MTAEVWSGRLRILAVVLSLGLLLSGCGGLFSSGAADLPLPGGADLGSSPYRVTADFSDVLDLVPQASVKVDNVDVGRVSSITLEPDGRSAEVTLELNGKVRLVEGTTARLEQTSLLGEKYVALIAPDPVPAGAAVLGKGATIGLASTSQAVDVEQVLGALSLLLNGGGLGQFQEIARELSRVSDGRPDEIRAFLTQIDGFVTQLDARKDDITTALDGLDRLGAALDQDRDKITVALEDIAPGLSELADQRKSLVAMLKALDRLSGVTVDTLDRSSRDIVADFKLLAPILKRLGKAGSDLPASLQVLLTYPFPDSVLNAIKGDYINGFLTLGLHTTDSTQPGVIGPSGIPPTLAPSLSPHAVPTSSASPAASPASSPTAAPTSAPTSRPTSSPAASPSASPSTSGGGR